MSEWISVKDRLPSEFGAYAVYTNLRFPCEERLCGHAPHVHQDCSIAYWSDPIAGEGEYFLTPHWESLGIPECWITHWMPLPAPPKGE